MDQSVFILIAIPLFTLLAFFVSRKKAIDKYFDTKTNLEVQKQSTEVARLALENQRKQLENDLKKIELEKQKIFKDAETALADERAKLKLAQDHLELEKQKLAAPYDAEYNLLKKKADLHQAERDAILKHQKDLSDQKISVKLADVPKYAEALACKLNADAEAKIAKKDAYSKYVKEFMRQEDYNGTTNSYYRIKAPMTFREFCGL